MKYEAMTVDEMAPLPVGELADTECTPLAVDNEPLPVRCQAGCLGVGLPIRTNSRLGKDADRVRTGGAFAQNAEFILFCRRGSLRHLEKQDTVWFNWARTAKHSKKPEAMLDLVERVSPPPYVELFARRARFGWDYWGEERLQTVQLPRVGETKR